MSLNLQLCLLFLIPTLRYGLLSFTFSHTRYSCNNDDTRLCIAFLKLSRLLSVLCRFSLSSLRRHALLGRSLLCKQALSTDGEEPFTPKYFITILIEILRFNLSLNCFHTVMSGNDKAS